MITITPNPHLSASSGLINMQYLDGIYASLMDEALEDLGREVIVHLQGQIQSDTTTNSQPQSIQFNPFFGRTVNPSPSTRNAGVKITPRDVTYKAHLKINIRTGPDIKGIGNLKENEAMLTVAIEALPHFQAARSMSIEGRRYSLIETRPIGFVIRRYAILRIGEIQESDIKEGTGNNG